MGPSPRLYHDDSEMINANNRRSGTCSFCIFLLSILLLTGSKVRLKKMHKSSNEHPREDSPRHRPPTTSIRPHHRPPTTRFLRPPTTGTSDSGASLVQATTPAPEYFQHQPPPKRRKLPTNALSKVGSSHLKFVEKRKNRRKMHKK